MVKKNHFDGRTMHIDVSRRFYQRGDSSVACKIIPGNSHKGLVISNKLKEELKKNFHIDKNYAKVHAICIYYLIREELDSFDNLVICNDEEYLKVKACLDFLFRGNKRYSSKLITSLGKLREISGDSKIRSYADNTANIYRRKALKPIRRKQRGVSLNLVKVNYRGIKDKWEELKGK